MFSLMRFATSSVYYGLGRCNITLFGDLYYPPNKIFFGFRTSSHDALSSSVQSGSLSSYVTNYDLRVYDTHTLWLSDKINPFGLEDFGIRLINNKTTIENFSFDCLFTNLKPDYTDSFEIFAGLFSCHRMGFMSIVEIIVCVAASIIFIICEITQFSLYMFFITFGGSFIYEDTDKFDDVEDEIDPASSENGADLLSASNQQVDVFGPEYVNAAEAPSAVNLNTQNSGAADPVSSAPDATTNFDIGNFLTFCGCSKLKYGSCFNTKSLELWFERLEDFRDYSSLSYLFYELRTLDPLYFMCAFLDILLFVFLVCAEFVNLSIIRFMHIPQLVYDCGYVYDNCIRIPVLEFVKGVIGLNPFYLIFLIILVFITYRGFTSFWRTKTGQDPMYIHIDLFLNGRWLAIMYSLAGLLFRLMIGFLPYTLFLLTWGFCIMIIDLFDHIVRRD